MFGFCGVVLLLLIDGRSVVAAAVPEGVAKAPERMWETNWNFRDVDIAKLDGRLQAIGIDLGLPLQGRVSVGLRIRIPVTALTDPKAYRFEGQLTSEQLVVGRIVIRSLAASVEYEAGILKLKEVSGEFSDERLGGPPRDGALGSGSFHGTASLQLVPRDELALDLQVTGVSASMIQSASDHWTLPWLAPPRDRPPIRSGRISGSLALSCPIGAVTDLTQYVGRARVCIDRLQFAGLPAVDFRAEQITVRHGDVELPDVTLAMHESSGSTGTTGTTGRPERTTATRTPAETGSVVVPGGAARLLGRCRFKMAPDGDFDFGISGDDLSPLALQAMGLAATGVQLDRWFDGKFDLRLTGRGASGRVAPRKRGGEKNDAETFADWSIEGAIASPALQVAGVDLGTMEHAVEMTPGEFTIRPRVEPHKSRASMVVERVSANYQWRAAELRLTAIESVIFGGVITGAVTIPRDAATPEKLAMSLAFEDLAPCWEVMRRPGEPGRGTVRKLSGVLSGRLDLHAPSDRMAHPADYGGTVVLAARKVALNDSPIGDLQISLDASVSPWKLEARGRVFDGEVSVRTVVAPRVDDRWSDLSDRIRPQEISIEALSIDKALRNTWTHASDFGGLLSATVSFEPASLDVAAIDLAASDTKSASSRHSRSPVHSTTFESVELGSRQLRFYSGRLTLRSNKLTYKDRVFSRSARLHGRFDESGLSIDQLAGDAIDGSIRVRGRVAFFDANAQFHPRADLTVHADRVRIDSPWQPLATDQLSGRLSGSATVAGYQERLRIRGQVSSRTLAVYGIGAGAFHSRLDGQADLSRSTWRVRLPTIRSRPGGGQLDGSLELGSAGRESGIDLKSHWRMQRLDTGRLVSQSGAGSPLPRGEIFGDATFRGDSMRTLDDLRGRFDLRLARTQGQGIPGLIAVSRLLGVSPLSQQRFERGSARGTVGRGVVGLEEFSLGSTGILVRADGKVFLRGGRLDLNALVATGDLSDIAGRLSDLAGRYALRTFLPTTALVGVTDLVRNRTIVLTVHGTTRSPVLRINPLGTLREEAVRFLLREGQRLVVGGIAGGIAGGLD